MLMEQQGSLSYLVLGFSLIKNSCSGALRSWSLPFHVPRELGDNHERNSSCFWNIRMYPLPLN